MKCEVCKRATRGACTNGRCMDCHRDHCTPGGSTGPGHGRGTAIPADKQEAATRLADAVKELVESQARHPVSSVYGPFRRDGGPDTTQEKAFVTALVTYSGFCR